MYSHSIHFQKNICSKNHSLQEWPVMFCINIKVLSGSTVQNGPSSRSGLLYLGSWVQKCMHFPQNTLTQMPEVVLLPTIFHGHLKPKQPDLGPCSHSTASPKDTSNWYSSMKSETSGKGSSTDTPEEASPNNRQTGWEQTPHASKLTC